MDIISNPFYTSSWICNISSNLYNLPCLWDDKLIFVLSSTLCCKSIRATLFTLFPHPFNSTFGGIALIDSLAQILGHLIALPINDFLMFHNCCRWHPILYRPFLCLKYSWHGILYYFWSVKLHCISQQQYLLFYYIFFFILLNCNLI